MKTEIAQHTPGPWRAEIQVDVALAKVFGPRHADGGDYAALFTTYNHADARLIAAAPELLEALERASFGMRNYVRGEIEFQEALEKVEAVIRKARGE